MRKMQKNSRLISILICLGTALFVILFDQITKAIVVKNMELEQSVDVIKNVFRFTYITNEGSAFGMLADSRWVFMIFSTLGILAMIAYVCFFAKELSRISTVSLGMIIGGGIGNMIDRLFNGEVLGHGKVVDFLDFCAFPELWKWIFNVADSFVCIGTALLLLGLVIEEIKRYKDKNKSEPVTLQSAPDGAPAVIEGESSDATQTADNCESDFNSSNEDTDGAEKGE